MKFSPAIETMVKEQKRNPKRVQREISKQMQNSGISTKSQTALKIQQEQNKQIKKIRNRDEKRKELERKFKLKQQKRKTKYKGH